MMFSVRSPAVRLAVLAAAMLCVMAAGESHKQASPLDHLDNADLTDLLDAELDETFLHRRQHLRKLEADTASPTAAPTPTPTLEDGDRGLEFTAAPTPSPTMIEETGAPATETSGASSWRSSASVASALVLVGSVAAAAVVA